MIVWSEAHLDVVDRIDEILFLLLGIDDVGPLEVQPETHPFAVDLHAQNIVSLRLDRRTSSDDEQPA